MNRVLNISNIIAILSGLTAFSQNPQHYTYDDRSGLPSNEVYSIAQDTRGFIWIGCDAGLYKFDGVHYSTYKCRSQKSKSAAGLCISSSGKLYCTNFQNQILYLENDSLVELRHSLGSILHLTCDQSGNLLVNHGKGFAVYNETKKTWQNYQGFSTKDHFSTRSARVSSKNQACFITPSGIALFQGNEPELIVKDTGIKLSSNYILEWWKDEQWMFPFSGQNMIYRSNNEKLLPVKNKNLIKALTGKQIANVRLLPDKHLWICTYSGLVRYNPDSDSTLVLYQDMAFSDCLIDREGNYWFSTLQFGLICVPDMRFILWNDFKNNKLTKICANGDLINFACANGRLGQLNSRSGEMKLIETGSNTDIQALNYIVNDKKTYFFTNRHLFSLNGNVIKDVGPLSFAVKRIQKIENDYFLSSSSGTYLYSLETNTVIRKLATDWSREIYYDQKGASMWICTNKGLKKLVKKNTDWIPGVTLLDDIQVLACDFNETKHELYAATFDGRIYSIDQKEKLQEMASLPEHVQVYRMKHHAGKLYLATNKGLWICDIKSRSFQTLTVFSGLASNNLQDLLILHENIWLATGNGLQKIPLSNRLNKPPAKVYLTNKNKDTLAMEIKYGEPLILDPEVNLYSSNGNFEYAYRIGKNTWVRLPATVGTIEIQNLQAGISEIHLKTIDHLGRDSENELLISVNVLPPFWRTWWFILLCLLSFLCLVFGIFVRQLKIRQQKILVQNEMNALKLTAVKSQMNPHFIFNVLTSIKGYIYENDKKKAISYLDDFSGLMRNILEMSEVQYVSLEHELKTMQLYIDLEAMMLSDFSYNIGVDPGLNTDNTVIPALLLQPYIENSFKHGLRHKQGYKKLNIHVSALQPGSIKIEITDNGIGREASKMLNSKHGSKHASFATSALEKRIELINRDGRYGIHLKTVDLDDATGTRITLTIDDKSHHN